MRTKFAPRLTARDRELDELKTQLDVSKSTGISTSDAPATAVGELEVTTRDSSQSTAVGNFAAFFDTLEDN